MKKKQGILSYFLIILGAVMASFSVALILLPNDAIDYGTAGVAIIISKLTGIQLSMCVLFVFLPFIVAGYIFLGKKFTVKAAVGSIVYMVGLDFFENIPFELNTEHFLAVAFGGAILGAGLALILRNGGCIDGSEILANIVVKKLSDKTGRNYSLTPMLLGFNALVYITVFAVIDATAALLSLLVYVVATAVIDHYTDHFEAIKQVTIITQDPDGIIRDIKEKLNKTCTIMDSRGAIAGENNTLICYISYFELPMMKEIISIHSGSFSTVSTIDEILR
ncbi:YitT family protein [Butyrivibrio sp. DSM 10294]|uniref:YitT family protein n=1 Tax=Butyrivibrio sp. DSM 10294 TaxID=2972457 RepID=UPI00234F7489|nr:YitT family protein [Butyrivibrio sp. DSM 10294]MDC7292246.1 YitT family protein [Butyrivibrio sp. DSM 10294]